MNRIQHQKHKAGNASGCGQALSPQWTSAHPFVSEAMVSQAMLSITPTFHSVQARAAVQFWERYEHGTEQNGARSVNRQRQVVCPAALGGTGRHPRSARNLATGCSAKVL